MGVMPASDSVLDASHHVFMLAFDLVDAEIDLLPNQLGAALASPQVRAAIDKTLLDFMRTTPSADTGMMSEAEAKKFLAALEKNALGPLNKEVLDQISKTPEYKRLEQSLKAFERAAKSSALGAWVDRNSKTLIVVGVGLVVGTATMLYVTKTGGGAVDSVVGLLKDKNVKILEIGQFKLSAGLLEFKPDARVVGGRVTGSMDLQRVKVEVKIGVLAQGSDIQQVEGEAVLKSGPINLSLTGSDNFQKRQVNLGLNATYERGKFTIGVGAAYKDDQLSGVANVGYKTGIGTVDLKIDAAERKSGGTNYDAMLTLTIPIH
jgi:hypothetical protein